MGLAQHHAAQPLAGGLVRVHKAHDPAAEQDHDPVGYLYQLVQIAGDQQHGAALPGGVQNAVLDVVRRGDVHAAGGLCGHQHPAAPGQLPRYHDLLLVAAGERTHHHRAVGGGDAVLGDAGLRVAAGGSPVLHQGVSGVGLFVVGVQQQVFKYPHAEDQAHALPVVGDAAHTGVAYLLGGAAAQLLSAQQDTAGGGAAQP